MKPSTDKQPIPLDSRNPMSSIKPHRLLANRHSAVLLFFFLSILLTGMSSCGWMHSLFGPKYGCPSDGKNVGAERILSGEKVPTPPKFKS